MHRFFRKGIFFVFPAAVLTACLVLVLIAQCFHLDDSRLKINSAQTYNTGWSEEGQRIDSENEDVLVLKNTLPEITSDDFALCFRSDSERIRVYVEDEEIYSYGWRDETPFGRRFGSLWNMIPLQEEFSGKTVSIEITDLSNEIYNDNHRFYLDQQNRIILTLLTGSWPIIINCTVAAVVCITMLVSGILHLHAGSKAARARIYLGIFVLLSQIYVFCDAGFPNTSFPTRRLGTSACTAR